MANDDAFLQVDIETKEFDDKVVFSGLKLSLRKGEIISIFGPSGCGKTTLLRMIAGLESAGKGDISLPMIENFSIGFIFQKPVLYPHLNVGKNILLGSKQKLDKHHRHAASLRLQCLRQNRHKGRVGSGRRHRLLQNQLEGSLAKNLGSWSDRRWPSHALCRLSHMQPCHAP